MDSIFKNNQYNSRLNNEMDDLQARIRKQNEEQDKILA